MFELQYFEMFNLQKKSVSVSDDSCNVSTPLPFQQGESDQAMAGWLVEAMLVRKMHINTLLTGSLLSMKIKI